MNSLQSQSVKISKQPKELSASLKKFICGCGHSYMSYPALYRHVRQKHNGEMPKNTKVPKDEISDTPIFPGRPSKPKKAVDNISASSQEIEVVHDQFINLLCEKLGMASEFGRKQTLEAIVAKVKEITQDKDDKWLKDFREESDIFLEENKEKEAKLIHLEIEKEFYSLDHSKPLKVLVWFVMWLVKIIVKMELLPDLCLIFSKMWKVLDQNSLQIQDLDNKLVWKKIIKECDEISSDLSVLGKDKAIMEDFIQKCCFLIGKPLEKKNF